MGAMRGVAELTAGHFSDLIRPAEFLTRPVGRGEILDPTHFGKISIKQRLLFQDAGLLIDIHYHIRILYS
jgi:hypothetical protein